MKTYKIYDISLCIIIIFFQSKTINLRLKCNNMKIQSNDFEKF